MTNSKEDLIQVLLFDSAGRDYAIPLTDIREVVDVTEILPAAETDGDFVGVMVLRNEPIPLVTVHVVERRAALTWPFCVILERGGVVVGILVEHVLGIRVVTRTRSIPRPGSPSRREDAFLDQHGGLVRAVDVDAWLESQLALPLLADNRPVADRDIALVPVDDDRATDTYLALTAGDRRFAVATRSVLRAVTEIRSIPLPRRPGARLSAVIELSGNVVPVLQLVPDRDRPTNSYVIVGFAGERWAIAADQVHGIVVDTQPGEDDDADRRQILSEDGLFHEVVDLPIIVGSLVPDFVSRADSRKGEPA